jgi:hypothetical protein
MTHVQNQPDVSAHMLPLCSVRLCLSATLQVDDQLEQELCVPSSEDERRQAVRKPERYNPTREHYKKLAVSNRYDLPTRSADSGCQPESAQLSQCLRGSFST